MQIMWYTCFMKSLLEKAKKFVEAHERPMGAVMLFVGFVLDSLTLRSPDRFAENAVFVLYTIAAAACIVLVHLKKESRHKKWFILALQFFLGALFSMSLVFYYRASSFSASWPFLLLLAIYLVGNEIWRDKYSFLVAQVGVFFTAVFSYFIFLFPILLKAVSAWTFVVSGLASLAVISLLLRVIRSVNPEEFNKSYNHLVKIVGGVFILINILYFTHLIPPIPLFLKDAGIYHSIARNTSGGYVASSEEEKFSFFRFHPLYHILPGEGLYAWSSIYSPSNFDLGVIHTWEHYDEEEREWVRSFRINLSISGGREQGFRTYSKKSSIEEGLWRVTISNDEGRVIGRMKFEVEYAGESPILLTEVK